MYTHERRRVWRSNRLHARKLAYGSLELQPEHCGGAKDCYVYGECFQQGKGIGPLVFGPKHHISSIAQTRGQITTLPQVRGINSQMCAPHLVDNDTVNTRHGVRSEHADLRAGTLAKFPHNEYTSTKLNRHKVTVQPASTRGEVMIQSYVCDTSLLLTPPPCWRKKQILGYDANAD